MKQICIQVPSLQSNQTVDVEVTVNGKKRLMNYRLESFDWSQGGYDTSLKIQRLRELIHGYDPGWELVQIGVPDGNLVPVMFRRSILPES
ncbi:MAG: hypothetical protein O3B41_08155 [Bacteroidetes bacterium]|nr:hypothetical protein [Bacteroidota bacterium]